MIAYLEPFIGVNIFKLGWKITYYEDKFDFEVNPSDGIAQESYTIKNPEITLFLNSDKVIESIGCYEECLFKGRNIIGMSLEEFLIHTEEKFYGIPDCINLQNEAFPQYVYEFDSIGLQVWVKDGGIVTVIVSEFIEDDR